MSPSGSKTVLWRETNPRFWAASQHLEHFGTSNCSIHFQSTPCVCKGIWASELTCLWGRTDCKLIHSRCEETCEDAVWSIWLTFRTVALWRWNTWVFLFQSSLFFPLAEVWSSMLSQKRCCFSTWHQKPQREQDIWLILFFCNNVHLFQFQNLLNRPKYASFNAPALDSHNEWEVERHPVVKACLFVNKYFHTDNLNKNGFANFNKSCSGLFFKVTQVF